MSFVSNYILFAKPVKYLCYHRGSGPDTTDQISDQTTDFLVVKQYYNKPQDDKDDLVAFGASDTSLAASPSYLQSNIHGSQMSMANELTNTLVDFSGSPSSVPVVAFEDGGRRMRPPLSGSLFNLIMK